MISNRVNGNNYSINDNSGNSNTLPLNSGDATYDVPDIVTIFSSD